MITCHDNESGSQDIIWQLSGWITTLQVNLIF